MRILITSGGTKVKIDRVRDITNMSNGTFGAKMAHVSLELGHRVCFFCAKRSCTPFSQNFDFYGSSDWEESEFHMSKDWAKAMSDLADLYNFCHKHHKQYTQPGFRNFDDYETGLRLCLSTFAPDIVILAAAVSDYGVTNFVDGKIRSTDNQQIDLHPLPKLINRIKQWHPNCFLVGFKLLLDASELELIVAARDSIRKNGCDLVVANNLASLQQGDHQLILVTPKNHVTFCRSQSVDPYYLAKMVVLTATEMLCTTSYSA